MKWKYKKKHLEREIQYICHSPFSIFLQKDLDKCEFTPEFALYRLVGNNNKQKAVGNNER